MCSELVNWDGLDRAPLLAEYCESAVLVRRERECLFASMVQQHICVQTSIVRSQYLSPTTGVHPRWYTAKSKVSGSQALKRLPGQYCMS